MTAKGEELPVKCASRQDDIVFTCNDLQY